MLQQDIEAVYEEFAAGIDAAGEADAENFLARVCLLLGRELADKDRALDLIRQALPPERRQAAASKPISATRAVETGNKP